MTTVTTSTRTAKPTLGRDVYTTGQIARMLSVAPRTVSKWFDAGLLRGHRIPGSSYRVPGSGGDRRIRRDDLLEFLHRHGMHVPPELNAGACVNRIGILAIGLDARLSTNLHAALPGVIWFDADGGFEAGALAQQHTPDIIIIDLSIGRSAGLAIVRALRRDARHAGTPIVALANEDEIDEPGLLKHGITEVAKKPVGPALLGERLTTLLAVQRTGPR